LSISKTDLQDESLGNWCPPQTASRKRGEDLTYRGENCKTRLKKRKGKRNWFDHGQQLWKNKSNGSDNRKTRSDTGHVRGQKPKE